MEKQDFDADDSMDKLYKRGKGFYVMGNTELALRHFREALKLDPEHACKADYKQAKKLQKIMEKIEGVMGKEVEGKGRMKSLERDEQCATATTAGVGRGPGHLFCLGSAPWGGGHCR